MKSNRSSVPGPVPGLGGRVRLRSTDGRFRNLVSPYDLLDVADVAAVYEEDASPIDDRRGMVGPFMAVLCLEVLALDGYLVPVGSSRRDIDVLARVSDFGRTEQEHDRSYQHVHAAPPRITSRSVGRSSSLRSGRW